MKRKIIAAKVRESLRENRVQRKLKSRGKGSPREKEEEAKEEEVGENPVVKGRLETKMQKEGQEGEEGAEPQGPASPKKE